MRERIPTLRFPSSALLVLVGVALSGTVARALPSEGSHWARFETAHYTLFSDAPDTRTRDIAASLETFRAVLVSYRSDLAVTSPRPTYVYVFKSDADALPYKVQREGKPTDFVGFFVGEDQANYVTIEAPSEQTALGIVYHESAHQLLEDRLPRAPAAIIEGLAEYYRTFRAQGRVAQIGLPIDRHVSWLALHTLVPLRDLLSIDEETHLGQSGDAATTFYAESWALVHDLLRGNPARAGQLDRFLAGLRSGAVLDEAFRDAFGTTYDDLLKEVRGYLNHRRFPYQEVKFSAALKVDLSVQVIPMERDEALCRLGDLLAHLDPDRAAEAENHFTEALRMSPSRGCTHAGMGYLRYSQKRYGEAAASFEKAVTLDPDDFMACYLYGRTLLALAEEHESPAGGAADGAPADPSEAAAASAATERAHGRNLLAKAIQLRPDFAAPYVALGASHTLSDGSTRDGIALLDKARQMLPSRMDVVTILVYLQLRAGERDAAQDLVDTVLARAGDPQRLEQARQALREFDRVHEEAKAQSEERKTPPVATPSRAAGTMVTFESVIASLEKAVASTTDPVERRRLQEQIERIRRTDTASYNAQVAVFNRATDLANHRDYRGAIALLEKVRPDVREPNLAGQIDAMLERLKKDAAKSGSPR